MYKNLTQFILTIFIKCLFRKLKFNLCFNCLFIFNLILILFLTIQLKLIWMLILITIDIFIVAKVLIEFQWKEKIIQQI